jgi:hypothetical protein
VKARKTANIEFLINQVNSMILNSVDSARDERIALGLFIERVLMEHGCYKGFRYLDEIDMEKSTNGMSNGIRRNTDGDKWEDIDHSRVMYAA